MPSAQRNHSNTASMERVLLVEPDIVISGNLTRSLTSMGLGADIEGSGRKAVGKLIDNGYRMAVLNRRLPDLDGLSVLASIRSLGVAVPVIIIDAAGSVERCVSALRCGADEYLSLPFDWDEFAARTMAILRRESRRSQSSDASARTVLHGGGITLDRIRRSVSVRENCVRLRPMEFRLLEFMMLNPERVITRAEMLEVLWHRHFDPGTNLIEVHIRQLRSKIGDFASSSSIRTVRGAGYVFQSDASQRPGAARASKHRISPPR